MYFLSLPILEALIKVAIDIPSEKQEDFPLTSIEKVCWKVSLQLDAMVDQRSHSSGRNYANLPEDLANVTEWRVYSQCLKRWWENLLALKDGQIAEWATKIDLEVKPKLMAVKVSAKNNEKDMLTYGGRKEHNTASGSLQVLTQGLAHGSYLHSHIRL